MGEAGLASSSLQFTLSALDAAPWRTKRDNSPIIARCFSLFGIVGESPSCFFSVPLVQTSDYIAVTNKTNLSIKSGGQSCSFRFLKCVFVFSVQNMYQL